MEALQILVADRDAVYGQTIVDAISDSDAAVELFVRSVRPDPAFLKTLVNERGSYDVVVMCWEMFGEPIELTALRVWSPSTAIIVNSSSDDLSVPRTAFAAGAAGFFRRDSPASLIRMVVNLVIGGEAFAAPNHLQPQHVVPTR